MSKSCHISFFQNIPAFIICYHNNQPCTGTSCSCKPEPVQYTCHHKINHSANYRNCQTQEAESLDNLLIFFFSSLCFSPYPGNSFFNSLWKHSPLKHPLEIPLDTVIRYLGSKSQYHLIPIRTGTHLQRIGTCKIPKCWIYSLYSSGKRIMPILE